MMKPKPSQDEIRVGEEFFGRALTRCDLSLETVYVETLDPFFSQREEPIATFARAADADRFAELWNFEFETLGWRRVCDCCHCQLKDDGTPFSHHDGRFACRGDDGRPR